MGKYFKINKMTHLTFKSHKPSTFVMWFTCMVPRKGLWSTKHRACKDRYLGFHSIHSKLGKHIYCKRLVSYSCLDRSGGVFLKCSQQFLSVTAHVESEVCSTGRWWKSLHSA